MFASHPPPVIKSERGADSAPAQQKKPQRVATRS
jgi:hypothetical protein